MTVRWYSTFTPPIKQRHDITDLLLKLALNTINQPTNKTKCLSRPFQYLNGMGFDQAGHR